MKRVRAALLTLVLLGLLTFITPHTIAQQDESTPLRFGTTESVISISAVYTVETENVAAIEAFFVDAVKDYAYANFRNRELRIAVASVSVIDLSQSIGSVTAVLENGSRVAPKLTLKSLTFNGKKATCNLVPGNVSAVEQDGTVSLSVPVHNDFPCDCVVMIAAYRENGQMIASDMLFADGTAVDQVLESTLKNCEEASYVEVFYLTLAYEPITGHQKTPL